MKSVLGEISRLRNGAPITIDYNNSNRYRLVVNENNGTKTAYYFSSPIYSDVTRKLIDIKFQYYKDAIFLTGTNASIILSNNVFMKNTGGVCSVELPQKCAYASSQELRCGNIILLPTINGVAFRCTIKAGEKVAFVVDVDEPFLNIRANDRCFALMKEQFRPFVVFSCIGSLDAMGNVISPAKIEYQKLTDKRYKIFVSSTGLKAQYVLFEANLYENKLFQDTTVESANKSTNNAFGTVGFIGNTASYGEQWLYSRIDFSKIPEIMDKQIGKAVLHIPKFNSSNVDLSTHRVLSRFCSFGSNWNNKISVGTQICVSYSQNGYQNVDIMSLLVNQRARTIAKSEGFILKSEIKGAGFSVIATGDSCFAPQILEINYK